MTPGKRAAVRAAGAIGLVALVSVIAFRPSDAPGAQQSAPQPPAISGFVAPEINDTAGLPGVRQPVFFRHDVHAGQYQMDCRYCHYSAEYAPFPGIPTVKTCMGCHIIAGAAIPEVAKVREAATANRAIEWIKVHHMPPFVHFPHMRHVKGPTAVSAGVTCQTCHGPVETMPQVYQFSSLKMGWCLDCHRKNNVTTDCTACHY